MGYKIDISRVLINSWPAVCFVFALTRGYFHLIIPALWDNGSVPDMAPVLGALPRGLYHPVRGLQLAVGGS